MNEQEYVVSKKDDHARLVYAKSYTSELDAQWEAIRRSQNSPEFVYYVENQDGAVLSTWQNGARINATETQ